MSTDASELGRLLDTEAIRKLITTFGSCLDSRDWTGYAQTFTEDGVFEILGQRRVGRQEIAAGPARDFADYARTQHHTSDHVVTVDGDAATVRWEVLSVHVLDAAQPSVHADVGGIYTATCTRTADGWRFAHVRIEVRWTAGAAFNTA